MKRSEMIDALREDDGVCVLISDLYKGKDAGDILIRHILGLVESKGMLPPTIPTRVSDPDRYTGYTFYDPPMTSPNEWEEEDEN